MPHTFKPFEELEFTDDFMFGKVMRDPEICAAVVERLLKIKVGRIEYPELQKEIAPYYTSRGVRLDVYARDSDKVFDIEMQTATLDALGKRTRYYQSMLDIDDLMKGADYSELKESYVIFICKRSPFEGFDLPVYSFRNTCAENPSVELGDKSQKVIYNASAYENETDPELKAFLGFVCNGSASDSLTNRITALIAQAKAAEANKTEYMAVNLHDRDIRMAERLETAIGVARNLIAGKAGSLEQIAAWVNIPLEQLQAGLQSAPAPCPSL